MKRAWEKFMEPWESVSIDIDEIIEADNHVVTRTTALRRPRRNRGDGPTGVCWTFRDGQLTRLLASNELTDALEAAGCGVSAGTRA